MGNFTKKQIELISSGPSGVKAAREWVSEVSFRIRQNAKTIEGIFNLEDEFNLETESIARAAIAETKALIGILANAVEFHNRNPELLRVVSDAYVEIRPRVDEAVEQYQTVKGWFDN